jgi:hypothetical protein
MSSKIYMYKIFSYTIVFNLKGLSHEMELAFDGMYCMISFRLK